MKKTRLLSIICLGLMPFYWSCFNPPFDYEEVPFQIYDSHWSGINLVDEREQYAGLAFTFHIEGGVEASLSQTWAHIRGCLFYDDFHLTPTPKESFVVNRVQERLKGINEEFFTRCRVLWEKGGHEETNYTNFTLLYRMSLTTVYIRKIPSIYADKTLFGEPAGADLSSYFLARTKLFRLEGIEYQVSPPVFDADAFIERAPFCAMKEYYSPGTVLPWEIILNTTKKPEELGSGERITLTFTFPVVVEHYWSWLLELYDNPDAVERFSEEDWTVTVKLNE